MQLAEYILVNGRTSIVPGAAFGAENHQRFSYATSMEKITTGVERIAEALAKLK
jgi:aspartate aminotransferase